MAPQNTAYVRRIAAVASATIAMLFATAGLVAPASGNNGKGQQGGGGGKGGGGGQASGAVEFYGYSGPMRPPSNPWSGPPMFQDERANRHWLKNNMGNNSNMVGLHYLGGTIDSHDHQHQLQRLRDQITWEREVGNRPILRISGLVQLSSSKELNEWQGFVRTVVSDPGVSGRVWGVQIWNEPNGARFGPYCTGGSGQLPQFKPVFDAGRSGATKGGVSSSDIISPGYTFVSRCGQTWEQQIRTVGSWKGYGRTGAHLFPRGSSSAWEDDYHYLKDQYKEAAGKRPIFVTEQGACVGDPAGDPDPDSPEFASYVDNGCGASVAAHTEEGQAAVVSAQCLMNREDPQIKAQFYWHPYHFDYVNGTLVLNRGMSLFRSSLSGYEPRPALDSTRISCNQP